MGYSLPPGLTRVAQPGEKKIREILKKKKKGELAIWQSLPFTSRTKKRKRKKRGGGKSSVSPSILRSIFGKKEGG